MDAQTIISHKHQMNQSVNIGNSKHQKTSKNAHFQCIRFFKSYQSTHRQGELENETKPNNDQNDIEVKYKLVLSEMTFIIGNCEEQFDWLSFIV